MNFCICLEVDYLKKINVLVFCAIRPLDIVVLENVYLFWLARLKSIYTSSKPLLTKLTLKL